MSYITMSSDVVAERCNYTLKLIKEKREELKQAEINKIIKRSEESWLRKLFRMKPITKEEAESDYDCLDWIKMGIAVSYLEQEDVAKKLLHLSRWSDTMQVSAKDWDHIL